MSPARSASADALIEELGYGESGAFVVPGAWGRTPEHAHTFSHAEAACRAPAVRGALRGVYMLGLGTKGCAATPVVYLCEAPDEHAADRLHRMVWNQGVAPFLIVHTPAGVRLYTGFDYEQEATSPSSGARSGVLDACIAFEQVAERLSAFRANAINDGTIWEKWGARLQADRKVDDRLLAALGWLATHLNQHLKLDRVVAHALIGRFIYLRYLRDRNLLDNERLEGWGLDPHELFGREIRIGSFETLIDRVDGWLNGAIFPIPKTATCPTEAQVRLVAGAMLGDAVDGQLHLDFRAYDFSHIPIVLLSSIYEQFVAAEKRSLESGAYYTPIPLVQFVIAELDELLPLGPGMRVLDPACGSGAFLVLCFQLLVDRARQRACRDLSATELRDLLTDHIFGLDQDEGACRVAELSLALALLDHLPAADLAPETRFQLPTLHNRNIIVGDFFDPQDALRSTGGGFDWIVGNPPWAKADPKNLGHSAALSWMAEKENRKRQPVCKNDLAQAFAWKAPSHFPQGRRGMAALVLPAMTLFEEQATFRTRFLADMAVSAIANLANLREVLFKGRARAPAAVFFYCRRGEISPSSIYVYSPLLINQEANRPSDGSRLATWTITVDHSELRVLSHAEVAAGDTLPWKVAMWGSHRDARLLGTLSHRFPSLETFESGRHRPGEGLQLRTGPARDRTDDDERVDALPEVVGKLELDVTSLRDLSQVHTLPPFAFAENKVSESRGFVREGRSSPVEVCRPPHVIVSAARTFSVYSDDFVVIPPRQVGIAGRPQDRDLLRAIALYLGSSFVRYHQFMESSQEGIRGGRSTLQNLKDLPVPFRQADAESLRPWVAIHAQLVSLSTRRWAARRSTLEHPSNEEDVLIDKIKALEAEVDKLAFDALGLSPHERWLVEDFIGIKLPLVDSKLGAAATGRPDGRDLCDYARALRDTLDEWLDGGERFRHQVTIVEDARAGVVQVAFAAASGPHATRLLAADAAEVAAMRLVRARIEAEQGQWLYFNRNLFQYCDERVFVHKPMQRFWWTRSRALADADRIIADLVSAGGDR